MVYTKTFWEDVRLAYEQGDEPIAALARRFGIAKSTLSKYARSHGWQPRRQRKSPGQQPREATIRRLYRTIDLKLAQLEARMQNDKDIAAADHERETRAIGQLIRNFEKVSEIESSAQNGANRKRGGKPEPQSEPQTDGERFDPQHLRAELAQRILRLRSNQPNDS